MRIDHTLVLFLAIILNDIDLSSHFECLPNGDPIPGVPRSRPSYFPDLQSPERTPPPPEAILRVRSRSPPARPKSPVRSLTPAEPPLRVRSKSPPASRRSCNVLGYQLEDLRLIRLIPNTNPHKLFEIRKYTFPANKPIRLRARGINRFKPMPTDERNVLTTSTGDILAILENNTRLRGIYTTRYQFEIRVKINIDSGAIKDMTSKECIESPVGPNHPISKNFEIVNANDIPARHQINFKIT